MATVLLEIGTEEIPAGYIPPALTQLADLARTRLQAERIACAEIATWGTPRRIALYLTGVTDHQAPAVREVRGPAVSAAFATNGEPTQAAIGFARSQGVSVSDLRIRQVDSGEFVTAVFRDEGRPTIESLPDIFTHLITHLTFPKTMRWGSSTFRFARPIGWIVSLMDDQIVPFTIDGLAAGRLTRGHRFLAPGELDIPHASEYTRILEENHVLVNPEHRRGEIRSQLEAIATQDGATIVDDGSLLEATTFHVEYPTALRCNFDAQFLSLPEDVLTLVLRDEQQFFPLREAGGKLLPAFLAVRNGDKAYLGSVREGYESVARAKLIDALFFFEQDTRVNLFDRVEELRGVMYQERLGTMHDKVLRVQTLAGCLVEWLNRTPVDLRLATRAAILCKADLVSAMVTEHPQLRGIMGGAYARRSEEPEPVATAISEHYRPQSASEPIPASSIGQLVALADKLDTVAACFAVGLVPTGEDDPYALRREAMGIVRILAEGHLRLTLPQVMRGALAQLDAVRVEPAEEIVTALVSFCRRQLEALLTREGYAPSIIKAVLAVSADLPADARNRARVIRDHLQDPAFMALIRQSTRLTNVSRGNTDALQPTALIAPAERDLYTRYAAVAPQAADLAKSGDFTGLLALLATLLPAIDRFVAEVVVMADDPTLRQARQSLAAHLAGLFRLLGDLSMVEVPDA